MRNKLRILFIHQNFPGQFKLLSAALAAKGRHEIICLGDSSNLRITNQPIGMAVYGYRSRESQQSETHHYLLSTEQAVRRGQDVVRACQSLLSKGFEPDLIIGHPGWGEMLFLPDVFPRAKVLSLFEFFYQSKGADVGFDAEFPLSLDTPYKLRIRNTVQLHALATTEMSVSPTHWQKSTYPARFHKQIEVIHEGIETERLKPDPTASFRLPDGRFLTQQTQVITYISRQLEPYRGFHRYMRALPGLQKALPNAQFVVIGGDGVSYGGSAPKPFKTHREWMISEVGDELDLSRVHFLGKIAYADYLKLLKVSKLHIYLTYPFVLSWSVLEAMACGVPLLASSTPPVKEVIKDGINGYLCDFFDPQDLVEKAHHIMCKDQTEISDAARQTILQQYDFSTVSMPAYEKLIKTGLGFDI